MNPLLAEGTKKEREGKPQDALDAYSKAISLGPNQAEALTARANLLQRFGHTQQALADFDAAAIIAPQNARVWQNRGNVLFALGRLADGIASLRKALALDSALDEARVSLGAGLQMNRQADDALAVYRDVLERQPDHPAVCSNMATLLIDQRNYAEAARLSRVALAGQPNLVAARFNLGLALEGMHQSAAAATAYRHVLDLAPNHARAMLNLGVLLMINAEPEAAVAQFEAVLALEPGWSLAKINSALIHRELGHEELAQTLLQQVLTAEPANLMANVAFAVSALPTIPASAHARDIARASFRDRLEGMRAALTTASLGDVEKAIGAIQPFFLAYHPEDNRALLSLYGDLCHAALSRFQPQLAAAPRRDKLVVGIVSAHVRQHSVWDAITRGFLTQLDRDRFSVTVFSLDPKNAAPDTLGGQTADCFINAPTTLAGWIDAITTAAPDILIYPEIGMNQKTFQLASLRLAKRQFALWGHPETTGLPTIDGYLSSEMFEPENGDSFYREKLIRLPGTGSFYEPVARAVQAFDLATLRDNDRTAILVCPGASFKYQPEDDAIFAKIAQSAAPVKLVFFHMRQRWVSERLKARMRLAFEARGVDFDQSCVFLDWLAPEAFHGLLSVADGVLDTIGFSGFNTAMQAIEMGAPYLAFEGRFMRGRLASGVMTALQIPDLIAHDPAEFVQIATMLARDPAKRAELRGLIVARRACLYRNQAVVRGLEIQLLALMRAP